MLEETINWLYIWKLFTLLFPCKRFLDKFWSSLVQDHWMIPSEMTRHDNGNDQQIFL